MTDRRRREKGERREKRREKRAEGGEKGGERRGEERRQKSWFYEVVACYVVRHCE